jgi:hypothetical protein
MASKSTGTTSTISYTLLIVLRTLWGISMVEGNVGYVCHWCTRWTGPTVSRNWWYELFSIIYVVHKLLLIHSFTAVFFFLKQKLPSFIVPIQMPGHGRLRLALGHNMMFMSTYSISLRGEKILIHGWSQIMKARRSWRIGQKVMFMLFHGSEANILFIDHIARWSRFQKVVDARGGAWALSWGLVASPFVNSRQSSTVRGVPCTVEPV